MQYGNQRDDVSETKIKGLEPDAIYDITVHQRNQPIELIKIPGSAKDLIASTIISHIKKTWDKTQDLQDFKRKTAAFEVPREITADFPDGSSFGF